MSEKTLDETVTDSIEKRVSALPSLIDGVTLSTTIVQTIFLACLYMPEEVEGLTEPPEGCIVVNGVVTNAGFNPERIAKYSFLIEHLLLQLPANFMRSAGGGWSFLEACNDKDGRQWTSFHKSMDELFCLGIAAKKAEFLLPRDMWAVLPGGMPYVIINDIEPPVEKEENPIAGAAHALGASEGELKEEEVSDGTRNTDS